MSAFPYEHTQSLVLSGLGKMPASCLGFFHITDLSQARTTLHALTGQQIWFGAPDYSAQAVATQIAFSATGLRALGHCVDDAHNFARAFTIGMTDPFNQRALGDLAENSPEQWRWSDREAHIALWCYAADRGSAEAAIAALGDLPTTGLKLLETLTTERLPEVREHFGFRDGLSNPSVPRRQEEDPDGQGAGDFVFGLCNALGRPSQGPRFGKSAGYAGGSYLVIRQLEQDVGGFWKQWLEAAGGDNQKAIWLASKATGRWPNGMPLDSGAPGPMPELDQEAVSKFSFAGDKDGLKCPFGAHVRRSNPREDAGAPPLHRILRRGRVYGPVAPESCFPNGIKVEPNSLGRQKDASRGILFACLNTDIARQFEFVQQTWINNPKFQGLYDEIDPITGSRVKGMNPEAFTIPAEPFRHRLCPVSSHVRVRGGGYFYLPGRPELTIILG